MIERRTGQGLNLKVWTNERIVGYKISRLTPPSIENKRALWAARKHPRLLARRGWTWEIKSR